MKRSFEINGEFEMVFDMALRRIQFLRIRLHFNFLRGTAWWLQKEKFRELISRFPIAPSMGGEPPRNNCHRTNP